jgi:hypothetical protein
MLLFIFLYFVYKIIRRSYFERYLTLYSSHDYFPINDGDEKGYDQKVNDGFGFMKTQKVVICGLLRNHEHMLNDIIYKVEELGKLFNDYKVVIVENDSSDNTREKLLEWASKNNRVTILGCGINEKSCKLNLPKTIGHTPDFERIKKMSYLRNLYLEYVKTNNGYDYMIPIDLDIIGSFYFDGIANSFYYFKNNNDISAICSNGIIADNSKYYDTFPFIELNEKLMWDSEYEKQQHDKIVMDTINYNKGQPLKKVISCFGGLSIYKISQIIHTDAKYSYPPMGKYGCEHTFFNRNFNMYMNPSMIYLIVENE